MDKIKTVVIVNDFDYIQGGASKVAIDTAKLLHNSGMKVIFFSACHNEKEFIDYGYQNVCVNIDECLKDKNKLRGIIRTIYNNKVAKEFKKLLKTLDVNNTVIHYHGWTKCLSSSIFNVAFKLKFKTIVTLHDYFIMCPNGGFYNYKYEHICPLKGNSLKCITTNCDSRNYSFKLIRNIRFFVQNKIVKLPKKIKNVIYISDFSWKILKNNFPTNVNAKKINNPISIGTLAKIEDITKNEYYLYVGRVCKEKGVEDFCKAATNANIKAIIVGDGEQLIELKSKYSNIEFTGWKNKEEVAQYMLKARALVFPSKLYEGSPLTIMEALAIGLPCIISDCSAATDYIFDDYNGKIYSQGLLKECIENYKKSNLKFLSNNCFLNDTKYIDKLLDYFGELL